MKNNAPAEIDDNQIIMMMEGLTPELITVCTENLAKEYKSYTEGVMKELKDDEEVSEENMYRTFIGYKIALLLNVTDYLVRQMSSLHEALNELTDVVENIGEAVELKSKKKKQKTKK